MTPDPTHLAEHASPELGCTKLLEDLCCAIDSEQAANRTLRLDCRADCQEHRGEGPLPVLLAVVLPQNVTRIGNCA